MLRRAAVLPLIAVATSLAAEPEPCGDGPVSVSGASPSLRAKVCTAAEQALALFGECGLTVQDPVEIMLTRQINPHGCFGLFHCGEGLIELHVPETMAALRKPDSAFAHVPIARFFDSIVVHELTHALYDVVPCPVAHCMATAEYLAYSYQIESLSPEDRAPFEAPDILETTVPRDFINAFIVLMSPDRFAVSAWAHLNQRDDQCAWRQGIMSGTILFDREVP
ncbi:DUF6639 family protein [Roseivivax sp. CAU 1753]